MNPSVFIRILSASLLLLIVGLTAPSSAQPAGYVAASGFADIRQFGSTIPGIYGGSDGMALDATGSGGALRVGTFLHRRWSLEFGGEIGSRTTVEFEDPFVIAIFPPPPPFVRKASTSIITVSTMVGFHPPRAGRVRLGYLAGFSFVSATYKSDYPSIGLPASIFSTVRVALPEPTIFPPRFVRTTLTQKHNTGALALGFEAAIDLAAAFAVVPEVRALMYSTPGGNGVFLIRPGIGVRWGF